MKSLRLHCSEGLCGYMSTEEAYSMQGQTRPLCLVRILEVENDARYDTERLVESKALLKAVLLSKLW